MASSTLPTHRPSSPPIEMSQMTVRDMGSRVEYMNWLVRGFEPVYIACISHAEEKCIAKHTELWQLGDPVAPKDQETKERLLDELVELVLTHGRLLGDLDRALAREVAPYKPDRLGNTRRVKDMFVNSATKKVLDKAAVLRDTLLNMTVALSLVVPMIIMVYWESRTARVIVVLLAVLFFSAGCAALLPSRETIIGSAAAYAAVMVVFIGNAD